MRRASRSGIRSRLVYVLNNTLFTSEDDMVSYSNLRHRISGSR